MTGLIDSSIQEARNYLVAAGAAIETFPSGTIVYRRGERLSHVYYILSGRVNIQITTESGSVVLFRQMEEGAFFGELAVLRREPSIADAVALENTSVLSCPSDMIHKGIEESPAIRALLIANLTGSVSDINQEIWNFYQNADAFELFLYPDKKSGPLIDKSASAKNLLNSITRHATTHDPLFLHGERGSGKFFIANQIHELWSRQFDEAAGRKRSLFVSFDFSKFGDNSLNSLLRNLFRYGLKLAEFNLDDNILKPTENGTLILRRIDNLNWVSQEAVLKLVRLIEETNTLAGPKIHLITTATSDIRDLATEGRFLKPLSDILTKHVIVVPPLRERKADILPLARHFLIQADPNRTTGFSPSAERRIANLTLRQENAAGLRKTIEFAALLSGGAEIVSDQIVNDPDEDSYPFQVDVGIRSWFQWATSRQKLFFLRRTSVVITLAVTLMVLLKGNSHAAHSANHLFWWVLQPMMVFFFFFMGRIFCSVCPVSSTAELVQRFFSITLPVPRFIKKWGIYFSSILFIGIITAEYIFQMPSVPLATAGLIITLTAMASCVGFIYERRAWCRYLCPWGTLAASFGIGSTLHVHANSVICAEICKNHVCIKGTDDSDGCPVFQHPLHSSSSNHCVHCFRCINTCPHNSIHYLAHPPLQNIWGLGSVTHTLTPFCFFLFIYSPIILWIETQNTIVPRNVSLFALTIVAVVAAMAFYRFLNWLFGEELENDNSHISRIGYSFIIMAWGPLIAYILTRIPLFKDLYIDSIEGSFVGTNLFTIHTPLYTPFQIMLILVCAALALFTFSRIRRRQMQRGVSVPSSGAGTVIGAILAHALISLAIILL